MIHLNIDTIHRVLSSICPFVAIRFFFKERKQVEEKLNKKDKMSYTYYEGNYPKDNFSVQPYPLDDPRVVVHFYYNKLQYVLYVNPTDSRGYRCIVRFIDNNDMKSTINRKYSLSERAGLWKVVTIVESALEDVGEIVQVAKAGNNAHTFDVASGQTQLGHSGEGNFLHAHLWVRGNPESEPVPGIPLGGPCPGEVFDMRGKTSSIAGNDKKKPWKEEQMKQVVNFIRKCLFKKEMINERTFDDVTWKCHTNEF